MRDDSRDRLDGRSPDALPGHPARHRVPLVLSVASLRVDPHPDLFVSAPPVEVFDASLASLVDAMFSLMRLLNGVGLAATQVGVPLRVFVYEASGASGVMVNPEVSGRFLPYHPDEGCLSVPGKFFVPLRHRLVDVSWQDLRGVRRSARVDGLLAEIVEHEVDHLDGVLLYQRPQTGI